MTSESSAKRNVKILVIDDSEEITRSLKEGLEARGDFDVETYNDPEEALANFSAGTYDLVILDVRMPRMNGFEVYRALKKIDEKTMVCFLTAFPIHEREFIKLFPEVEVVKFLTKPVSMRLLIEQLDQLVIAS